MNTQIQNKTSPAHGASWPQVSENAQYNFHFELKLISDMMRQAADEAFAQFGLTGPQAGFLHYIVKSGGSLSQKDLEQMSGVSHPTVVGIVTRLQEKGFISISTDPADRRRRIITLTQKAEDVTAHLAEGSALLNDNLVIGLSPSEQKELSRLLQILDHNLRVALRKENETELPVPARNSSRRNDSGRRNMA